MESSNTLMDGIIEWYLIAIEWNQIKSNAYRIWILRMESTSNGYQIVFIKIVIEWSGFTRLF